jgi:hypothetical protein
VGFQIARATSESDWGGIPDGAGDFGE